MTTVKTNYRARRLAILRLLAETADYGASARLLADALADQALAASHDAIAADLAWLEEQQLVTLRVEGQATIAVATVRGLDIARGRAIHPGVARPDPGE
jgi:DNA-binding transcriptional ArsR family regulator